MLSLNIFSCFIDVYIYIYVLYIYIYVYICMEDQAESTRELIYHRRFINQFPPDIIKSMNPLKRINTKMCRQRISALFNYIYIYIYIYIILFLVAMF